MTADQLERGRVYACHDGAFRHLKTLSPASGRGFVVKVGSGMGRSIKLERLARMAVRPLQPGFAKAFLVEMEGG